MGANYYYTLLAWVAFFLYFCKEIPSAVCRE